MSRHIRTKFETKCIYLAALLIMAIGFSGPNAKAEDEEAFSEEQLLEVEAPVADEAPKEVAAEKIKEEPSPPPMELVPAEDPLKENGELAAKESPKSDPVATPAEEVKKVDPEKRKKQNLVTEKLPAKKPLTTQLPPKTSKAEVAPLPEGGGFKVLAKRCPMRRAPASDSKAPFQLKPGRKIWIAEAGPDWFKALDRDGNPVYFDAKCFEK